MTFRARKYIALSVCLLFAMGVAFGGSGVILCVGDCGHSKLETMCMPQCSEPGHAGNLAALDGTHAEHAHCGDCSDLSVDSPQWLRRSRLTAGEQGTVTTPAYVVDITRILDATPGDIYRNGGHRLVPAQNPTMAKSTTVCQC